MPAHRKTTVTQITQLLEYLEHHRLGSAIEKKDNPHWVKLSRILNKLPGEPKDPGKWKSYWSELKWHCRKKASDGRTLLAYEKRVLNLAGTVKKYPMLVLPDEKLKIELKDDNQSQEVHNMSEQGDSNSLNNTEMEFDNKVLGFDQDDSIPDPMPTINISVRNYQSDQEDQREDQKEDVPEWVRRVEHSRLQLEERTTAAIEQMSVAITSVAESLRGVVASLNNIEESIRSLNRRN